MGRFVCIGDAHMPWMSKATFTKILDIIEAYKADYIVQVGDLYDFYSFSRFPKKPGLNNPELEVHEARLMAEEFWRLIQKKSPRSKCYQIRGNHCVRPIKMSGEIAPALTMFVEPALKKIFEFENVTSVHDYSEELLIEDKVIIHGYRSKLGDHCKHNMQKTIVGHSHRGGAFFYPTFHGKQIWELNCGHIADPAADPLKYSPQKYVHWTRGVGLVDDYGPRFIPL